MVSYKNFQSIYGNVWASIILCQIGAQVWYIWNKTYMVWTSMTCKHINVTPIYFFLLDMWLATRKPAYRLNVDRNQIADLHMPKRI